MTSLVTPSAAAEVDDGPAIAELHRLHAVQRAAFLADPYPGAMVPRAQLDDFVSHAEHYAQTELLGYTASSDCTGIITVVRGTGDLADAFLPPYGATAQAIVDAVFALAAPPPDADSA